MSNRASWMNRYCWRRRIRYESADRRILPSDPSSNSPDREINTVQYECCSTISHEGNTRLDVYSSGSVEVSNNDGTAREKIISISDWRRNERKALTNIYVVTGLKNDTIELPRLGAA